MSVDHLEHVRHGESPQWITAAPVLNFVQAFRDPGILPRNLDPDPPTASTGSEESVRQPLPRDLKVRNGL